MKFRKCKIQKSNSKYKNVSNFSLSRNLAMASLLFVALGAGGIRACDVVIGGDQFVLPQQQTQMDTFFSNYYACVNIAVFVATFVSPLLRQQECLESESCYVLVFLVSGVALLLATGKYLTKMV